MSGENANIVAVIKICCDIGRNDVPTYDVRFGIYEKSLSHSCKEQAYYIALSMTYAEHDVGAHAAAAIGLSLTKVKNQGDWATLN
mmetsp:Transcript_18194/g.45048  ORF Transcript_18194/g.45048 Transcript_18194/m.45048 type:complete len:85 (+) Transcript_18194:452-706(+)